MSMSLFLFSWRYLDPIGFLFGPQFLYWPQFIGFWAAIMIWGNEVTKAGIAEIQSLLMRPYILSRFSA
jgi:hypothetical protein